MSRTRKRLQNPPTCYAPVRPGARPPARRTVVKHANVCAGAIERRAHLRASTRSTLLRRRKCSNPAHPVPAADVPLLRLRFQTLKAGGYCSHSSAVASPEVKRSSVAVVAAALGHSDVGNCPLCRAAVAFVRLVRATGHPPPARRVASGASSENWTWDSVN
jgi:hypothetical protein